MVFSRDLDKLSYIVKNGVNFPIEILSGEKIPRTDTFKNNVHKIIGDQDRFEFIGKGDTKATLPLYFKSKEEYEGFLRFIEDGNSFLLSCNFFPFVPVSIEGNVTFESYYKGFGVAKVNITTAVNINRNKFANLRDIKPKRVESTVERKKELLNKLRNFAKSTFDFVQNTNQKVGKVTNTVSVYSSAIENSAQGLASVSTIITNPLSSINNSASRVIGGVKGVVTALQNSVSAIRQAPSSIDNLIDDLLSIGDSLNNLFDLGDPNTNNKYNNNLLTTCANSVIDSNNSPNNNSIPEYDPENSDPNNATNAPEFFLTSVEDSNSDPIDILLLSSILINIYENSDNSSDWNKVDLEDLRTKTETIYNYIISKNIDSDSKLQLDLARNNFLNLFITNYNNANSIIEVQIISPTYLLDVVYSVNGNLDFYEETKKLNNIIGSTVENNVLVISNGTN